MNVIVLAAGQKPDIENGYPYYLSEENGISVIEKIYTTCTSFNPEKIIYAFLNTDIRRYHLDNIIELLGENSHIISVNGITGGAVCTTLLALEHINDSNLLLLNANETINVDFSSVIDSFQKRNLDAGVITFPSLHPQYSYVLLDNEKNIIEASERKVISRYATAGFYWYKNGMEFVEMAMNMIKKYATFEGKFYICPVFNEYILRQKKIGIWEINRDDYIPLKTKRQIEDYDKS